MKRTIFAKLRGLLLNSRFWILAINVVLSINIAGFIQFKVPPGTLRTIRIEQTYGFLSLLFLYLALLASPLTRVFPTFRFKDSYLHAKRAFGVAAFYYAFLHVYISFFNQLYGFAGIQYYDRKYEVSMLFGVIALIILFVLAIMSLDWLIDRVGFKNWKLLHGFVYLAGLFIMIHVLILGPHYNNLNYLSILTIIAIALLLILEAVRIYLAHAELSRPKHKRRLL